MHKFLCCAEQLTEEENSGEEDDGQGSGPTSEVNIDKESKEAEESGIISASSVHVGTITKFACFYLANNM